MRILILSLIFTISYLTSIGFADSHTRTPTFSLHKMGEEDPQSKQPTLLVIGGIQGDEPGGFHAASILTTHYKVKKGNVWIVPNLNFPSIIKRSRGIHGDLNRKFATIKENDPEYVVVERIKSIIVNEKVDLILNLHDGSGFFRPKYIDKNRGPHRWGQSIIIDQATIEAPDFADLHTIANDVVTIVNTHIPDPNLSYRVKDTKTAEGNEEMAKTLTFFAINNAKPAFGVEASKTLPKAGRVYHHLLVLESFMDRMGIEYERDFSLTVANVGNVIQNNRDIAFYDNRIFMEMNDVRNQLRYFPLESSGDLNFWAKNPLIAVVGNSSSQFQIYHGNERITTLNPQFFDYDTSPPTIEMEIDGTTQQVNMGAVVQVNKSFKIQPQLGYRANAIGFSAGTGKSLNEAGIEIEHKDFKPRYSLNISGNIFRVEFYKTEKTDVTRSDKFAGMILVKFKSEEDERVAKYKARNSDEKQ